MAPETKHAPKLYYIQYYSPASIGSGATVAEGNLVGAQSNGSDCFTARLLSNTEAPVSRAAWSFLGESSYNVSMRGINCISFAPAGKSG